jgi:FkbM family methyltransferase
MTFTDTPGSQVGPLIEHELQGIYDIRELHLHPGDVILDIGAHVGMVACHWSLWYPEARILSYEPVAENYANLKENVRTNGARNVRTYNLGVTADGRHLMLRGDLTFNSGGPCAFAGPGTFPARSTTLEAIMTEHDLQRVELLKLDCEGAEHEILARTPRALLQRCRYLIIELHQLPALDAVGSTIEHTEQIIREVWGSVGDYGYNGGAPDRTRSRICYTGMAW